MNCHKTDYMGIWVALLSITALIVGCTPDDVQPQNNIDKDLLLQLVNSYRSSGCNCGSEGYFASTTSLVWNNLLESTAHDHSKDMNAKNFFSHEGSNGSNVGDRLTHRNYFWSICGENIAKGESLTEQKVIEGWINSPGHCKNIMNPAFKEMGISKEGAYWTQVFGTSR